MKTPQVALSLVVAGCLLLTSAQTTFAQLLISETWVSGTVTDQSNTPVNGGSVTVTCGSTTKGTAISSNGTYALKFTQAECKTGDSVSATASTGEGSGSNSATVQNSSVNGPVVDLDVAVIDITVPEFGLIGGLIAGAASVAGYVSLKLKKVI